MAYPNYYPATYQPYTYQQPQSPGIVWVQGEAGAKAYPVAAGNSVMMLDSEASVFYLKSTDASGMPMPLRIFDFTERTAQQVSVAPQLKNYVTREELEARIAELKGEKE